MFAVVVRVLLLLGCVPLLHPPGVCACEAWAGVLPAPDADHHDHDDGDECPHCPGATADAQPPRPADTVSDPFTTSVPVVVEADPAAPAVVALQPRPSAAWPSAPPLYVSHCALVC